MFRAPGWAFAPPPLVSGSVWESAVFNSIAFPEQAALCAPSAPGDSDEEDAPSSEPGALEAPYGNISQNVLIDF